MKSRVTGVLLVALCIVAGTTTGALAQQKGDGSIPPPWPTEGTGSGGADSCRQAEPIQGCGTFAFDNSNATTDGNPHPACDEFGTQQINNDVWFCWQATENAQTVDVFTCNMTGVDTKIAVYGPAPNCQAAISQCIPPSDTPALLDCNDDFCGLQTAVQFSDVTAGEVYLIRVGTFPGASGGSGDFEVACDDPIPVELQEFDVAKR